MAKQPHDEHDPKKRRPGEPELPPEEGVDDVVEFFADEPPPAKDGKEPMPSDSVFDDDLVDLMAGPASGPSISGQSLPAAGGSQVRPGESSVIRGEPISESVPIEPLSETKPMKPDSDVTAASPPPAPLADEIVDLGEADEIVDAELMPGASDVVALPESAVQEEAFTPEMLDEPHAVKPDSDVKLGQPKGPPEKEPVLDLDESLQSGEVPVVKEKGDKTVAFNSATTDGDIDISDLVDDAVDLGAAPPRAPGQSSAIDPLAEAIESGVRLDEGSKSLPPVTAPSVEFDDLVTEEDEASAVDLGGEKPAKKAPKSAKLPRASADDLEEATDEMKALDVDELLNEPMPSGPKSGTTVASEDDIAAELLAADDLEPPAKKEKEKVVAEAPEEDFAEEVAEEPAPAGKGPTDTMTTAAAEPFPEPKKRGWGGVLGGTALGLLLALGGAAGVWYAAPDLIPESPNAPKKPPQTVEKPKSAVELAHADIDNGNFEGAVTRLKDATDDKEVALRGQAMWLQTLKKHEEEKTPVNASDADVKAALQDLAKDPLRRQQVQAVLAASGFKDAMEEQKKSEEKLKEELKTVAAEKETAETALASVTKVLAETKQLDGKEKLDSGALQKIVKDLATAKVELAKVAKTLEEAKIEGGVDKLVAAKKDVDDRLAAVDKLLSDEKIKAPGAKGVQEILQARDQIAKDREDLDKTIQAAAKELEAGELIPAGSDPRKAIVEGAKAARVKSESPLAGPLATLAGAFGKTTLGIGELVRNAYEDAAVVGELNYRRVLGGLAPSPEQQLDRLMAALQNADQVGAATVADANKLASFVLSNETKASDTARAKAHYVQGLVLRHERKYADARKAFDAAKKLAKDSTEPWAVLVRRSHSELTDPTAYYLPRVERLREENLGEALKEIGAALEALGNDPQLLAQRGLLKLETSQGKTDPQLADAVRKDAEAALANSKTAVTGAFLLGRLAESTGDFDNAEKLYRKAIEASKGDDERAAAIRLALGRLLLKERTGSAAEPADAPEPKKDEKPAPKKDTPEEKKDAAAAEQGAKVSQAYSFQLLIASLAIQQVGDESEDDPAAKARLKESEDLAKILIQSKDKKVRAQGYMLLGEAMTRQGQRTEGLKQYAKGLELLYPASTVTRLLEEHPAFQVPDALARANPLLAEKHYGMGLHFFYDKKYADAEVQFRQAIAYFDKDARYYYFLGLAQLEQHTKIKRDAAYYAWEQASRLEANSRPRSDEVNIALERIQGSRRTLLDSYRAKTIVGP